MDLRDKNAFLWLQSVYKFDIWRAKFGLGLATLGLVTLFALVHASSYAQGFPSCEMILAKKSVPLRYIVNPPESLSQILFDLVRNDELPSQKDQRLAEKGWIIENGGLCASMCSLYLLKSIGIYEGIKLPSDMQILNDIGEWVQKALRKNFAEGLLDKEIDLLINEFSRKFGFNLTTELYVLRSSNRFASPEVKQFSHWREGFSLDKTILTPDDGTLFITMYYGPNGYHATLSSGIELGQNHLLYVDPNFPSRINRVSTSQAEYDAHQETLRLELPVRGAVPTKVGQVVSILKVNVSTRVEYLPLSEKNLSQKLTKWLSKGWSEDSLVEFLNSSRRFGKIIRLGVGTQQFEMTKDDFIRALKNYQRWLQSQSAQTVPNKNNLLSIVQNLLNEF